MNFRNKLLVIVIPIVMLSIAAVAIVTYKQGAGSVLAGQEQLMQKVVEKTLNELDTWFKDRLREGLLFSKNKVFIDAAVGENKEIAQTMLNQYQKASPVYENIFIADTSATIRMDSINGASVGIAVGKIPIYAKMIEKTLSGGVGISPVAKSPATGRPVVAITTPMYDVDGKLVGIQGNPIELNKFSDGAISQFRLGENGYLFMVDDAGTYLAHPNKELLLNETVAKFDWGKEMLGKKAGRFSYERNNEAWMAYFNQYPEYGWRVVATVPMKEFMGPIHRIRWIAFALGTISVVICVVMVWWITGKGIIKPLKRAIGGLNGASDQVSVGAGQVASSSQSLAEGTSEQAASIEETGAALEEMASMTQQNADHAKQADQLMKAANQVVVEANDSMERLTGSMSEISAASDETSKIIKTIDEIAFQTNLLALNAAVEAARAGEAGAGFAVVADEVRNLAIRAADAARDTSNLIEGTVHKVTEGSDLVANTNDAFGKVADSAGKVGALVAEIATASNEQALGIDQLNGALTEMDKVVQQNAASAEESASASEEMSAQAEDMRAYVRELVVMIGGRGNKTPSLPETTDSQRFASKALPNKSHGYAMAKKEISPDQAIPMDEGDFKNF